jgi:DNA-binding transcriptional MerR regulator
MFSIGLLRPACVDPASGYRFYQASQLAELNRVIALKDLGFTLQQVQAIIDERVSAAELRGMLKLRRAEIHAQIEAETTRLARIEARLLTIEDEASWSWPKLTARRPSFTTARWTTCCLPARPWRGGSTLTGTVPPGTPARSPSNGLLILISG